MLTYAIACEPDNNRQLRRPYGGPSRTRLVRANDGTVWGRDAGHGNGVFLQITTDRAGNGNTVHGAPAIDDVWRHGNTLGLGTGKASEIPTTQRLDYFIFQRRVGVLRSCQARCSSRVRTDRDDRRGRHKLHVRQRRNNISTAAPATASSSAAAASTSSSRARATTTSMAAPA